MLRADDDKPPTGGDTIFAAVATAVLTTLVTELVMWGIDEMRAKYGRAKPSKSGDDR